MNILRAEGLVVDHRTASGTVRAIANIDLTLVGGTSLAVTGPSGCGKSTLLCVLAGLAVPTAGSVRIGETIISALSDAARAAYRKSQIGVVYQADNLLPFLTVAENVQLQLALCADTQNARQRVLELLEQLGLAALAARMPDQLSGGQRQRVAVARAIVHRPTVILADEPTGALDHVNAAQVIKLLCDAQARLGATLIVVTHDPSVACQLNRTITMQRGRIVTDSEVPHVC